MTFNYNIHAGVDSTLLSQSYCPVPVCVGVQSCLWSRLSTISPCPISLSSLASVWVRRVKIPLWYWCLFPFIQMRMVEMSNGSVLFDKQRADPRRWSFLEPAGQMSPAPIVDPRLVVLGFVVHPFSSQYPSLVPWSHIEEGLWWARSTTTNKGWAWFSRLLLLVE
jgi:hypothetical protein